jgi:hypothetical protein
MANQSGGSPAFPACERTDLVVVSKQANDPLGVQRCWWLNHVGNPITQPIMLTAANTLARQQVPFPRTFLDVGFRRADASGFVTALYYFNPDEMGIPTPMQPWPASPWHKDRITADPRRVRYADELRAWAETWAPVFYALK